MPYESTLCGCGCGTAVKPPARFVVNHHKRRDPRVTVWTKVTKAGPDDCWMNTWCLTSRYGHIKYRGTTIGAHVAAWESVNGPVPEGLEVCHRCNVKRCCNPAHLYLGTRLQNASDAARDGLYPKGLRNGAYTKPESRRRGELNGFAKLTEDAVRAIRAAVAAGEKHRPIALRFGVHKELVGRVTRREAWRHVV